MSDAEDGGRLCRCGPRPEAKEQRFIAAVKTWYITKESPDRFPPLQLCLRGITALVGHYDVE